MGPEFALQGFIKYNMYKVYGGLSKSWAFFGYPKY